MISILCEKRDMVQNQLFYIKSILEKANESIVIISKASSLEQEIEKRKGEKDYIDYEMEVDSGLLSSYKAILKNRNLSRPEQQEKFKESYEKYKGRYEQLLGSLSNVNQQLKEYDDCVHTLKRVDVKNMDSYIDSLNNPDRSKAKNQKDKERDGR
jgi:hypothetical protein